MRAVTHISFSILSLGLLSGVTHSSLELQNIICTGIASLLADIDTTKSTLGKIFYPISNFLENRFGHRTITHSLLFVSLLSLILLPLYFWKSTFYLAFLIGYLSHLTIDCLNKSGVPLLYPSKVFFVFPGKAKWRIEVGSLGETILCLFIIALAVLVWYMNGVGVRSMLNNLLGTPEMAIREYKANADKFKMNVKVVQGFYAASQTPVKNQSFEIIAAIDDKTFLVKDKERHLITIGASASETLQAQRETIEKIAPAKIRTRNFEFNGQKLGLMLPYLTKDCYISGTIEAHDRPKYVKMEMKPFKAGEFESIKISPGLSEFDTQIEFNNASVDQVKQFENIGISGELSYRKLVFEKRNKKINHL